MDKYDRRNSPRQRKETPIQVVVASDDAKGSKDSNNFIPGRVCNQSDEGFYIEIDRDLQPGSNVRIKMVSPQEYYPDEAHHMRDGRVIWCEKVDDATSRFGVGIKIIRKVIQAHVLTSRFR
ncbi:MAG: PilZ domain-containing protein [Deltaproteobacteria bacterium]|nr:PilZ domain-containing protein [Deltaproteobacteria bacterium]